MSIDPVTAWCCVDETSSNLILTFCNTTSSWLQLAAGEADEGGEARFLIVDVWKPLGRHLPGDLGSGA